MPPGARLALAVALVTVLAAACAGGSSPTSEADPAARGAPPAPAGPVVEVVPTTTVLPPLDPTAEPRTPLGRLRAGYLPVWSPDFDWAFPPEVCGSDWALDAIAEPTAGANLGILGDATAAAALSVMRYEHLVSRELAEPDALGQLCVAVATVGPARTEALALLASHLDTGTRSAEPPGHPDEVTIVAASPTEALAVACVDTGSRGEAPSESDGDAGGGEEQAAGGTVRAYLLSVSRGLEDTVTDIFYRVSDVTERPADNCDGLDAWTAEWDLQARQWAAEGQLWAALGRTVTVTELCESPPPDGPDECPGDW